MLKLFSMFVVVRGFNLALIVFAQYITAIFIMAPNHALGISYKEMEAEMGEGLYVDKELDENKKGQISKNMSLSLLFR